MNPITMQMAPAARRIVEQLLAVRPGEHILLITDAERPTTITQALLSALGAVAGETILMTMKSRPMGGVEPPSIVAAAMQTADAVLLQTGYSTMHTNATRMAAANGVRICDMWGFSEDMMIRGGITADYEEVRATTERLGKLMAGASRARLTTPEGTDLTMVIDGRKITNLFGIARNRGEICALPDGETVVSPLEGSTTGVMVNPFTIEKQEIAFPKEPVRVEVKEGRVASVGGGYEADFFARLLERAGPTAYNIAEFAIGTNPACRLGASLREAKKAWGTAHVGVGDSKTLGGTVDSPLHIDLIFRRPTVTVDGLVLVENGKIVA